MWKSVLLSRISLSNLPFSPLMLPNQRGIGNCKTSSVQSSFIPLIFSISFQPAYLSLTGCLWPCWSLLIQCKGSAALPILDLVEILPLSFFLLQGNHFSPDASRGRNCHCNYVWIKASTWRVTPCSMLVFSQCSQWKWISCFHYPPSKIKVKSIQGRNRLHRKW